MSSGGGCAWAGLGGEGLNQKRARLDSLQETSARGAATATEGGPHWGRTPTCGVRWGVPLLGSAQPPEAPGKAICDRVSPRLEPWADAAS